MKLICEKLTVGSDEGFTFKEIRTRQFTCPWHHHTEYELILTLRFAGCRMVGDDITPLAPGDLVLLGANLPHIWQLDPPRGRARPAAHILLVQFEDNFLGNEFWRIPATEPLRQLLLRAAVGLQFTGRTRERVARQFLEMRRAAGLRRMALFLTTLETLAASADGRAITSPGYTAQLNPFHQERMGRVFRYIADRFDQPLSAGEVAREACLSEGAFSRFFRRHSGRTFPEFVNQLRVSRACRLLVETELSVMEVALACGFENLSNFNRQFARFKHASPREYRRRVARPN